MPQSPSSSSSIEAERAEPMHMLLCEFGRLVPRPNVTYRPIYMPGCAECDRLAASQKEAYGERSPTYEEAGSPDYEETAAVANPTPPSLPIEIDRSALIDLIEERLTEVYHCTRVWAAWQFGTMTDDDFVEARGTDLAPDIADAVISYCNKKSAGLPIDFKQASEQGGWLPLSTAPDGVRVLLGPREAPVVGIVRQMPEWADELEPVASVVHYNGTVLVAGYHCSEWHALPDASPSPHPEEGALLLGGDEGGKKGGGE